MPQQPIRAQPRITLKQRATAVAYAREHGIKRAARHFGWVPRTVRAWVRRWEEGGEAALAPTIPQPRRRRLPEHVLAFIHVAREDHWSASETRASLDRVHGVRVSTRTIQRVFRDLRDADPGRPPSPDTVDRYADEGTCG